MEKNKNQNGKYHSINSHNTNDENSYFIGEPDHWQIEGVAHYDGTDKFLFTPSEPVALPLTRFRAMGLAQQHFDGTFDFIRRPRLRAQSKLIRKLAHGRLSKTKDGAIQLTLKVFEDEGVNISRTIGEEASIAQAALVEWQLKR